MNKQRYIALLKDPSALTKADIPDIEELIEQFPYCQNAHILLAKVQTELGSMHATKLSRKAALYTSDRNKLRRLLSPLKEEPKSSSIEKNTTPLLSEQKEIVLPETARKDDTVTRSPDSATVEKTPAPTVAQRIPEPAATAPVDTPVAVTVKQQADKHANDFLAELEENLKTLREAKARAAGTLSKPFREEKPLGVAADIQSQQRTPEDLVKPAGEAVVPAVAGPQIEAFVAPETNRTETEVEKTGTPEIEPDFFETIDALSTAADITPSPQPAPVTDEKPDRYENPSASFIASDPSEIPKKDPAERNDVLDLILSFDNRVKDYFDINDYSREKTENAVPAENTPDALTDAGTETPYELPFTNRDWKLAESRLEEQGFTTDGLLLNYLEYLRDQKNKKQKLDKKREKSIISRFIQKDPTISPLSYRPPAEDEADDSGETPMNQPKPNFISETFANLLEKQGKIEKAIHVYEELILKNPEKNSYFATRIQELKKKL